MKKPSRESEAPITGPGKAALTGDAADGRLIGNPLLWLVFILLLSACSYLSQCFPLDENDPTSDPRISAVREFMFCELDGDFDTPGRLMTDDEIISVLSRGTGDAGYSTEAKTAALFACALRRQVRAVGLIRKILSDNSEHENVIFTACLVLPLLSRQPEAADRLLKIYEETDSARVAASAVFGLLLCGKRGRREIARLEEDPSEYEIILKRHERRYVARQRMAIARRVKFIGTTAPFIIVFGAAGATLPPLLLLLLPFAVFPLGIKMGSFLLLTLATLAGFRPPWYISLPMSVLTTYVTVEFVPYTSSAYDIQFLCAIALINLRIPVRALLWRRKSAEEVLVDMSLSAYSRKMAVRILLSNGKELLPGILEIMEGPDRNLRVCALEALGFIDDDRAYKALKEYLEQEDPILRAAAIASLGNFRRPELFDRFREFLGQNDYAVRVSSIKAIGMYADRTAKKLLTGLLSDEDQRIREAAKAALSTAKPPFS